jgi:thymidylate kinase
MKNHGKLYIFEGIDNVGKSSIITALKDKLLSKGILCSTYSFPGKDPQTLGGLVYDFHHDMSRYVSSPVDPLSLQMLHVASHIDIINKQIIPDIRMGKIVLLDRSWWSTYAYGIANDIARSLLKKVISPEIELLKKIKVEKFILVKRDCICDYSDDFKNSVISSYEELFNKEALESRALIINNSTLEDAVNFALEIISHGQNLKSCRGQKNNKNSEEKSIITNQVKLQPSRLYDTYWKFAVERQNIFFKRYENTAYPWTNDPILSKYKFTNAYRASDRVSQYLIKDVIYNNQNYAPEDIVFRIIIFKLFNKVETWKWIENIIGEISYRNYSYNKYNDALLRLLNQDERIYSAAYIMPSGQTAFGFNKKHQNNLKLLEYMMTDGITRKIAKVQSMQQLYELLISYPTLGKFLAFQYCIDINYSELCDFDEMSFVKAGPGACNGIAKCFKSMGSYTEEDIIKYMADSQIQEFNRLGLEFKTLWGRPLQLIDCQNLFCETDKYTRVAFPNENSLDGRKRIKQQLKPNPANIEFFYPPKWGLNKKIRRG